MAKLTSLGRWRDGQGWTQAELADKLGVPRPTFQKMESGVGPIPPKVQAKIRKLEYEGLWPREEAQEASGGAVMREDLAELRTALKVHVEYWERGEEKVLQRLEALARKIDAIARHVGFSE